MDIVFADYVFINERGQLLHFREKRFASTGASICGRADCYRANCAGFFRRRVLETVGPFSNETLHYGMDYDFYLRAAKAGCRFGKCHPTGAPSAPHGQQVRRVRPSKWARKARDIFQRHAPRSVPEAFRRCFGLYFRIYRLVGKLHDRVSFGEPEPAGSRSCTLRGQRDQPTEPLLAGIVESRHGGSSCVTTRRSNGRRASASCGGQG